MKKIEFVEAVERAIADLNAKKATIESRAEEIAGRKRVLGYLVLVSHDKDASAELEQLNVEHSAISGALSGLSDAIAEGENRLQLARAAVVAEHDQAETRELAELLEQFIATGNEIDHALEVLVSGPMKMQKILGRMRALGQDRPNHQQFTAFSRDCVLTALGRTPWAKEFPVLPPMQRRRFADLVKSWASGIRARISPRMGTTEKAA